MGDDNNYTQAISENGLEEFICVFYGISQTFQILSKKKRPKVDVCHDNNRFLPVLLLDISKRQEKDTTR